MVHLSKSSNYLPSQASSFVAVGDRSHGSQYAKIRQIKVRAKQKLLLPMNVSQNFSTFIIGQVIWVSQMLTAQLLYTMITRRVSTGRRWSPTKAPNTSTFVKIKSVRNNKSTKPSRLNTFLELSTVPTFLQKNSKTPPTSASYATPFWSPNQTFFNSATMFRPT